MERRKQIGPKLQNPDHVNEEKAFLKTKKMNDSFILDDDVCEKNQNENKLKKTYLNQIEKYGNLKNNTKKPQVNLFNFLKKAKNLAVKIKRTLYFKNYKNLTLLQKKILNDVSVNLETMKTFKRNVEII